MSHTDARIAQQFSVGRGASIEHGARNSPGASNMYGATNQTIERSSGMTQKARVELEKLERGS